MTVPPLPQDPPSLDYPCEVDIKVFALASDELGDRIRAILGKYLTEDNILDVSVRESSKGKYQSLSCKVQVTDRAELDCVFAGLSAHPDIVMVI